MNEFLLFALIVIYVTIGHAPFSNERRNGHRQDHRNNRWPQGTSESDD
jgi:hypothetical protein